MTPEAIMFGVIGAIVAFICTWVADIKRNLWKAIHTHDASLAYLNKELNTTDKAIYGKDFERIDDDPPENEEPGLLARVEVLEEKRQKYDNYCEQHDRATLRIEELEQKLASLRRALNGSLQ